ncbi:MAG: hypothetical protein IT385_28135 [Deltaproteobacteria bacterium]|nr:hypothetical protein [Deltaproteobacteria bacterium]
MKLGMTMVALLVVAAQGPVRAEGGEITLPLDVYRTLEDRLRELEERVRLVPIEAAVTDASVTVDVRAEGAVQVVATVGAEVMAESQVAVPLLPAGTAVESATIDGQPLVLVTRGGDLVWVADRPGRRQIVLRYRVPRPHAAADALDLPLPPATVVSLVATLPRGASADVVPGEIAATSAGPDGTTITAAIPRASWARLDWGSTRGARWLVTGADYAGVAHRDTVRWSARFDLELLHARGDVPVAIPVAKADVAIVEAELDGQPAVLEARGDELLVRVRGAGRHVVSLVFDTRVTSGAGPTGTTLWTPRPPALGLALDLPGDKDLTVSPAGGVTRQRVGDRTRAEVHLPPTDTIALSWSEALPEGATELRANAEVFSVVRAADGVLAVTAHVLVEVTRGTTQSLVVALPQGVLVNAVRGPGVSDWRSGEARPDGTRPLTLHLDRDLVSGSRFEIDYELLVATADATAPPSEVPLATVEGMHRQRGMVALVRGDELEVQPAVVTALVPVGENQLPAWLRDQTPTKVTHTYKYAEAGGGLTVRLAPFVRESARFDATVDTLFSLAEGVLRAVATIEITIKAGTLGELDVLLPEGINVLSASAPSLREHRVVEPTESDKSRRLNLSFTREMEGAVKIELAWERILTPGDASLSVPLVHVRGATVEEGRLGLEALTAVEVKATKVERLLPIDVQELPQKLVLRTSNPLLLAYHYVYADPPAELVLGVKRHAEIGVQVATIDRAAYETLWTREGVALTRARYTVRNRGKQFLRVALPAGSVVWSAELGGQPVKPARDQNDEGRDTVLVPLSSSAAPFLVELVYVQRGDALGFTGSIRGELPIPDLVETESTWTVYLPDDLTWGEVESSMRVAASEPAFDTSGVSLGGEQAGALPLRIDVPRRGHRVVLSSLLANVTTEERASVARPTFEVSYRAEGAGEAGGALVFVGAFVLGLVALHLTSGRRPARGLAALGLAGGAAALVVGFGVLTASPVALVPVLAVLVIMLILRSVARRRAVERGHDPIGPAPSAATGP